MKEVLTEKQVEAFADSSDVLKAIVDVKHKTIIPFGGSLTFEGFIAAMINSLPGEVMEGVQNPQIKATLSKFVPVRVRIRKDSKVIEDIAFGAGAAPELGVQYEEIDLAVAKNLVRQWLVNSRFVVMPNVLRKVA